MVRAMPNRVETAAANRPCRRRPLCPPALALAAVLALALPGGCYPSERTLFLTFAGETPGLRTPFVEITGAPPLGRPPPNAPKAPAGRLRPAASPEAAAGAATGGDDALANAHRRVRQALADRDEEFALRKRSLGLYAQAYLATTGALALQAGDPLPANDARHRARLKAARDALDDIGGDIARLNALVLRIQRDRIAARRVAAAAQGIGRDGSGGGGGALAQAAAATDAAAVRMLAAGRAFAGDWLVYVSGQRETLARLAAQIAAARGPATVETIRVRQTLAE